MTDTTLWQLTATETAERIRSGDITAESATAAAAMASGSARLR